MRTLGPFAAPVIDTLVETRFSENGNAVGIKLHNLSGNLLRVLIGTRSQWVPAYTIERIEARDGECDISIANAQVEITNSIENQFLLTVADINDAPDVLAAFPGTYPVDITRKEQTKRAWDIATGNSPGAGIKATVTVAGVTGKSWELNFMYGAITATVAAADGAGLEYRFGGGAAAASVSGVHAQIGDSWQFTATDQAILGQPGQSLTVQFQTPPQNANNFQSVLLGAYITTGA